MKRSIHIEAPVEKVFDFVKEPRNLPEVEGMDPSPIKDVKLTDEGVGSYYSSAIRVPGLRIEFFDVYTEFIPNQRITDRCSSSYFGDFTFSFEPEGSGMQLTIEAHSRSFWRMPPLRELVDWVRGMVTERTLSAVKAKMEAPRPVRAAGRAAS